MELDDTITDTASNNMKRKSIPIDYYNSRSLSRPAVLCVPESKAFTSTVPFEGLVKDEVNALGEITGIAFCVCVCVLLLLIAKLYAKLRLWNKMQVPNQSNALIRNI